MARIKTVDLSDFLGASDLSEFLDEAPKRVFDGPNEKLSPPIRIILHWVQSVCQCGHEFEHEAQAPTVEHTLLRRIGFGYRAVGTLHIPMLAGESFDDCPVETQWTVQRIFSCPACLGRRNAKQPDLFATHTDFCVAPNGACAKPAAMRWLEMHKTSSQFEVEHTLHDMHKRGLDFDDLLINQETKIGMDYASIPLCDSQSAIDQNNS